MSVATAGNETGSGKACDFFVIGGGPALMVLAEKQRHLRFHVGESPLPHSLPILDKPGVLDEVGKIGVFKLCAEFVSEDATRNPQFQVERALTPRLSHAYQVRPADFDNDKRQRLHIDYVSWFIYNINDRDLRNIFVKSPDFLGMERAIISLLVDDFSSCKRVVLRLSVFKPIRKIEKFKNALKKKRNGYGR